MRLNTMKDFIIRGFSQMANNGYATFDENDQTYYVPTRGEEVDMNMLIDTHDLTQGRHDVTVNNDGSWHQERRR